MTETREKTDPIASSARDPIDRWLDVFVRLLRVPKQDAQRIRDELEDHLRARVDDLMVTGQSEPEAVRLAVAELGETAELARSFAAARTSPRRRLLMQTTVLAAAGIAIVTGSTALLSVQGVPSSSQPAIAQADAERSAEAQDAVPAEPVFPRDLRAAGGDAGDWITIGMAVELIEEVVGKPIMANYPSIFAHAGGPNVVMSVDHLRLKGLTLSRGIEVIGSALGLKANDVLVLQPVGDSFELGAQSFFDRRDATLIEYDLSAVLSPPDGPAIEPLKFQNTVTSLIEPTVWGGNARVGMVSRTMLVYAPPRIHSQINDLLKRVDARYTAYRDAERVERRAKLEQQVVDFAAEIIAYETRISEIQGEIGRVRSERGTAREMLFEIEVKSDDVNADQLVELKVRQAEAQDVLTVTESQMFDLERRLSNMKQSLAVTRGQLRSAEKSLQQLDEAARPVAEDDPVATSSVIYITGEISRPGTYHKCDGLTLRRAIAQAGGDIETIVEITRKGETGARLLASGDDLELKDGDLIQVR